MRGTSEQTPSHPPNRPATSAILGLALFGIVVPAAVLLFISNARTYSLLATTAQLAFFVAITSIPVGTFLAVLLARTDLPLRRSISLLLTVQLLLPLYLVTAAWQSAFGLQGSFTIWFDASRPWLDGALGATWVHAVSAVPWVVLIVGTRLRLVEPALEEDALTVSSTRAVLLRITLPQAAGSIGIAILWIIVTTASEMTATDLFQMRTFAEEVYTAFAATSDTTTASLQLLPGMLLTLALVMTALVACATYLPRTLRRRPRAPVTFRLGNWRWPLFLVVTLLLLIMSAAPLLSLVYRAGFETVKEGDMPTRIWTLGKFLNMVSLQIFDGNAGVLFGREISASLLIGGISAAMAVSLATLLAWQARQSRAAAVVMFLVVAACLAIPGPLIGKAVIWLLNSHPALAPVYDSLFAPALAQSVRALPLATLIMWYALVTVDQNVLDSARLDGAGSMAQLFRVAIPMRSEALGMAFVVAMVVSIGDLSASQLVLVPGAETLANRIFDRLHSGAYDQVSAVCLAIILACIGVTTLLAFLWKRSTPSR